MTDPLIEFNDQFKVLSAKVAEISKEILKLPRFPTQPKTTEEPMSRTLVERRAQFVYNAARMAAAAAGAPIIPVPWREREPAFRNRFLEVIDKQCGPSRSTSPEELHGSWMKAHFLMGWVQGPEYDQEKKIHPDLVPYADLGQLEQEKDLVFFALCEIARQWIYMSIDDERDKM